MSLDIFEFLTHERIIFFEILSCGLYTGHTDFRQRPVFCNLPGGTVCDVVTHS